MATRFDQTSRGELVAAVVWAIVTALLFAAGRALRAVDNNLADF